VVGGGAGVVVEKEDESGSGRRPGSL